MHKIEEENPNFWWVLSMEYKTARFFSHTYIDD